MMSNKSSILLLIICSATKTGENELCKYNDINAVTRRARRTAHQLLEGRASIYRLIANDPARKRYHNEGLVPGPDLGGKNRSGRYLPAATRYTGRFYQNLASDPLALLANSRHHVLSSFR